MKDLRLALRLLARNPGVTAVAVLTLGLGIGANTALFSVIHGVWLRPLPYPEPDRIVTLWERSPERGIRQERVSGPNYLDWCARNTVFANLAVSPGWEGSSDFNLVLRGGTARVHASYTSASLFPTLGVAPLLGRTLLPDEDRRQGGRVAVLGFELWKRHFGGDSNILGQTLTVDTYGRREYTIVGVMPPGFGRPSRCELWLPLGWMDVTLDERRSAHWHLVLARLKPGVSLARARAEMNAIQARLRREYPGETIGSEVDVVPLLEQALGKNLRTALVVLWGVVVGVLLIACGNVANLMLARAVGRQKEIAVRLALGASPGRLVRQWFVESAVLASLGGGLGLLLGAWGLHTFIALAPAGIPRLDEVSLDGTALAFTGGATLVAGLLSGLAPALRFSRPDLNDALKSGAHGATAAAAVAPLRNLLVAGQVALALILLVGAGLMLQSFARMQVADRGFEARRLLAAELDFSVSGFTTWVQPTETRPQMSLQRLMERLRGFPGVEAVGAGSRLLRRENRPPHEPFTVLSWPSVAPGEEPRAEFQGVSPGWIDALGARILRGRDFTEADTLQAPGVMLVNRTFADRFFGGSDPIGQHLKMGAGRPAPGATNVWGLPEWSRIVGVISDIKSLDPQPEAVPEVYLPYWQWPMQNPTLLLRATGDPAWLAAAVRRETRAVLPNLPPPIIRTMEDVLAESVAQPRLQTRLLSLFGALAWLLAAVGIAGVVAWSVGQRRRELAVRLALGASRHRVVAMVLRQAMRWVLLGLGVGLLGAMALTGGMRAMLYGVEPADPRALAAAAFALGATALFAGWLPARRAARVEPMEALRAE